MQQVTSTELDKDVTEALWGVKVNALTVSDLNQKMYERIEAWRNRRIEGTCPYVYLDGICLKRSWRRRGCGMWWVRHGARGDIKSFLSHSRVRKN